MFITLSGYPKFPFDEDAINPEKDFRLSTIPFLISVLVGVMAVINL